MYRKILFIAASAMFIFIGFTPSALAYKPSVTVYGFESKASSGFWHDAKWDIGTGMGEMLSDVLVNTGKFEVVERMNLSDITTEQDLVTGGRVSKKTGAETGKMKGAEYIIRGTITEFTYTESGGDMGLNIHGFSLGANTSEAHIAGIIRIYDATTGEIYASQRFERKVPAGGLSVGYYNSGIGGNIGGFKQTPLGKATQLAIQDMADFIVASIPSEPKITMVNCPKCGSTVSDKEKFCPKCGADMSLKVPETCPKCGAEISPETKFCPNCGTQIAELTCPSCKKRLAAGTNFCPHCGSKVKE